MITNFSNSSKKDGIISYRIYLEEEFEQVTKPYSGFQSSMSAALALQTPDFARKLSHGFRVHHKWTMVISMSTKEKELSQELHKLSIPEADKTSHLSIKFPRLQRADRVAIQEDEFEYERFVAHEAQIDEEYWAVAWLRAETHSEDQEKDRYVENYKRKFAEQEFNSLKTRCKAQLEDQCICIVMANKEDRTMMRNTLKSVVGTLDLSYGYLSRGQSFPGERIKAPLFGFVNKTPSCRFGYIANLCVAKSARRKGIARNMLQFAISLAKKHGKQKEQESFYSKESHEVK